MVSSVALAQTQTPIAADSEAGGAGSAPQSDASSLSDASSPSTAKDLATTSTCLVWEGYASAELARSDTGATVMGTLDRPTHRTQAKKENQLKWWQAMFILIASTISLGVLSLPSAVAALGLVPGILSISLMGIISFYTGLQIQAYMARHPGAKSFADLVVVCWPVSLGGTSGGRIVGAIFQNGYLIFITAAHVNIWAVTISFLESPNDDSCFMMLAATGAAAICFVNLIKQLKECNKLSVLSCASVASALIVAVVGVGLRSTSSSNGWYGVVSPGLWSTSKGFLAISNIVLSFVGHTMYPSIITEMENPKDFKKALACLEAVKVMFYSVIAALFFVFVGPGIASPALGSAPILIAKISYGLALVTIIVAGAIPGAIVAAEVERMIWARRPQYIANRGWNDRDQFISLLSSTGILFTLWALSWLLAVAVPVFSELLGLMGATFATVFGLGFPSVFFWQMRSQDRQNGEKSSGRGMKVKMVANALLPVLCIAVMAIGMYGSVTSIIHSAKVESRVPFSCASPQLVPA